MTGLQILVFALFGYVALCLLGARRHTLKLQEEFGSKVIRRHFLSVELSWSGGVLKLGPGLFVASGFNNHGAVLTVACDPHLSRQQFEQLIVGAERIMGRQFETVSGCPHAIANRLETTTLAEGLQLARRLLAA